MRVPMQPNFVPLVHNLPDLFGKRLHGMCGHEPCCFDIVFVPEFEKAVDADRGSKDAARYIGWVRGRAGLGIQPRESQEVQVRRAEESGTDQPLTASTSIPYEHSTRFGMSVRSIRVARFPSKKHQVGEKDVNHAPFINLRYSSTSAIGTRC